MKDWVMMTKVMGIRCDSINKTIVFIYQISFKQIIKDHYEKKKQKSFC